MSGEIRKAYEDRAKLHKMTTRANVFTFDIETEFYDVGIFDPRTRYVPPDKMLGPDPRMLSWAGKWYADRPVEFRASWEDEGHEGMVLALWNALDRADIVVGYNSDGFDLKWSNAEFMRYGLPRPSTYRTVDLYKVVRSTFRLPYYRLDFVAHWLGLQGKLHHEGFGLWAGAMAGDPRSQDKMRRYNIQDVRVTERVYDALRPWIPNHPNLALWAGHDEDGRPVEVCCNCGGARLRLEESDTATGQTLYPLIRCRSCGALMRRSWIRERTTLRPVK